MIALDNPNLSTRRGWSSAERLLGKVALCLGFVALCLVGGSGWLYASLIGAYVATMLFSIRCNGGIHCVFGLMVFWQSFQTVLFSQVARVALGKNPETRFDAAIPTILCEIVVTLAYGLAGLVASRIRINRDRPLFPPLTDLVLLKRLAVGGTILAVVRIVATGLLHEGSGPLHMLSALDSLAVGSAIGYSVIESGGRRLLSPLALFVIAPIVLFSLVGAGRGGLFGSASMVILAGWMFGYRFRFYQYALALIGLLVMVFIISPYSLTARARPRSGDFVQNFNDSLDILTDVASDPMKYQYASKQEIETTDPIYYLQDYYEIRPGNGSNILNRFGLIRVQDMIIADVLKSGTTGFANITPAFDYLVPSALDPSKGYQFFGTGNALAHRVPGLAVPWDHTTGITTGVPPDAFSAFGWIGALLLPFAGLLSLTLAQKFLVSLDMRQNVFGIVSALTFTILISEGTVATFIFGTIYHTMLLFVALVVATRFSSLLDFHYLRPKTPPAPWADGEPGVLL